MLLEAPRFKGRMPRSLAQDAEPFLCLVHFAPVARAHAPVLTQHLLLASTRETRACEKQAVESVG